MALTRRWARAGAVAVFAVIAAGCWTTETEVIGPRDSIQLAGRNFSIPDPNREPPTVMTWNAARAGYLDAKETMLGRFARLRGDTYLLQIQILRSDPELAPPLPPGRRLFAIAMVKLAAPRLVVQQPECAKYREIVGMARPFGVTMPNDRREDFISGTREAILGFIAATLTCTPERIEELTADAVTPGGPELAAGASAPGGSNVIAALAARCNAGDLQICFRIAQILRRGEGMPADPKRAAPLLEQVCHAPKGDVEACVDLALMHDRGEGVAQDPARATELLKKACAAGEMYGCEMLKRRQ